MRKLIFKFFALFIWILFCRTFIDPSVLQPTDLQNATTKYQSIDQQNISTSSDELYNSRIVIKYDLYHLKSLLLNSEMESEKELNQLHEMIFEDNYPSKI